MVTIQIKVEESDKKFLEEVMKNEGLSNMVTAFHHIVTIFKHNVTYHMAIESNDELVNLRMSLVKGYTQKIDMFKEERDQALKELETLKASSKAPAEEYDLTRTVRASHKGDPSKGGVMSVPGDFIGCEVGIKKIRKVE